MSRLANSDIIQGMEPSEIKKVFTANIKKYRTLNGMTQMELAIAADLSVGFLCDLESGKKWGTLETMAKLAKALRIKPYQLLVSEEDKNASVQLHEDLAELSQGLKNAVDAQIESLLQKYAE